MKMKVSPSCHFPLTKVEEGPQMHFWYAAAATSPTAAAGCHRFPTGAAAQQQHHHHRQHHLHHQHCGLIRNRLFYFILFCACLFLVFVVSSSFTHIIRPFRCRCRSAALPRLILAKYFDIFGFSVQFSSSSRLERFEFCVDASIELWYELQDNARITSSGRIMLLCCFGICEVDF